MGAQCKKSISQEHPQHTTIQNIQKHPAFGNCLLIKNELTCQQFGLKKMIFADERSMEKYVKKIQLSKEYDSTIPTLVQIYDFEIVDRHTFNENRNRFRNIQIKEKDLLDDNCLLRDNRIVLVYFHYFQKKNCLQNILKQKSQEFERYQHKFGLCKFPPDLKLNEYDKIDRLNCEERQFINIFYQEIEILRMIDHIIGAIFFLDHFNISHSAIRPDNILLDDQGKYILLDKDIFIKPNNYQIALQFLKNTSPKLQDLQDLDESLTFLAPETLPFLKNGISDPKYNTEKADVFSVGVLALVMCLLQKDVKIFEFNKYYKEIIFVQKELKKNLGIASKRYSLQFMKLLERMLVKQPKQRISFSKLIDELNPILTVNLQKIRKIYNDEDIQYIKLSKQNNNMMNNTFENNFEMSLDSNINLGSQKHNLSEEKHQRHNFSEEEHSNQHKRHIVIRELDKDEEINPQILKNQLNRIELQFQSIMSKQSKFDTVGVNQKEIKDEEERLLQRLNKLHTNKPQSLTLGQKSTQNYQTNYPVNTCSNSMKGNPMKTSFSSERQPNKQMNSNELYELYWKQYMNLKMVRNHQEEMKNSIHKS